MVVTSLDSTNPLSQLKRCVAHCCGWKGEGVGDAAVSIWTGWEASCQTSKSQSWDIGCGKHPYSSMSVNNMQVNTRSSEMC